MKLPLAAVFGALLAQGQQAPPTFTSSVDLVPVDVSIVDRTGRPVADLTIEDFRLTVDGRPRRIVSAQFVAVARHTAEQAPVPLDHSSNAAATGGRLIALVIDQGNIGAGTGKLAINAARRFISGLTRADRVALYTIPGAGPRIDFTSNHAIVQRLLDGVVGTAVQNVGPHNIGITEVLALERNDQRTILNVVDRECPGFRTLEEIAACQAQLAGEARALAAEIRARTAESLLGLRALFERLADVPGPKTVVLLSEGLLVERDLSALDWVAPAAAKGRLSLYVLQLEPPQFDASHARLSATRTADIDLAQQGLGYLTGLARGDVFRVTAGADFAFSRISRELSGYYLLGFAPEPGDRDGRSHRIRITVPGHRDMLVRARPEFTIDARAANASDRLLGDTLRSPLLATDIPVKVTTYPFWDAETRKLRVMIAAEIDRTANAGTTLSLAYAVLDQQGAIVATDTEPALEARTGKDRMQSYVTAVLTSPGIHTLKLAVVDSAGKQGSVEHTFNARLESLGQIRVGGILLADRDDDTGPVRTVVDGVFSTDQLYAYLELYADAPAILDGVAVRVEIAQREEGRAVDEGAVRFQPARDGGRTLAGEAAVTIGLLPPGDYVVRVVIERAGARVGQVLRRIRITADSRQPTADS